MLGAVCRVPLKCPETNLQRRLKLLRRLETSPRFAFSSMPFGRVRASTTFEISSFSANALMAMIQAAADNTSGHKITTITSRNVVAIALSPPSRWRLRSKFRKRITSEVSPAAQRDDRMAKMGSRNTPPLVITTAIAGDCRMESSEFIGHADWLRVVRQAERPTITFHFISSFPLFNARLVEDDGGPRLKVTIGPLRGRTQHIKVTGGALAQMRRDVRN